MLDFIVKYWVEVLFGIVVTAGSFICKRIYTLYKNEKNSREHLIIEEFDNKLNDFYKKTQQDNLIADKRIDNIEQIILVLKKGLLSMQGHQFREKCRQLLADEHELTLDEWTELIADHDAYKALDGNHEGDELFELVKIKASKFLTD